jgi:hypothetical protein
MKCHINTDKKLYKFLQSMFAEESGEILMRFVIIMKKGREFDSSQKLDREKKLSPAGFAPALASALGQGGFC